MKGLNWKEESDYDYLDDLSLSQLAFEYLRRNKRYQSDYRKITEIEKLLTEKHGSKESAYHLWRDDVLGCVHNPPLNQNESRDEWGSRAIMHTSEPSLIWYEDYYREEWGIVNFFPDPARIANPPPKFKFSSLYPIAPRFGAVKDYFEDDEPFPQALGAAVLVFDLGLPIKEQWERSYRLLIELRDEQLKTKKIDAIKKVYTPGYFADLSKSYLRVLDAKECGAKNAEIAGILRPYQDNTKETSYSASKTISKQYKQAMRYVNLKYQMIPHFKISSH